MKTSSASDGMTILMSVLFFFSSRRRHTRFDCDWSSDVCSSDLLLASRGGATNAPMPPPDKLVDALFTHDITNDAPGAAVLVAQNGTVLFKKGYGLADVAHGTGFAPDTKSRIGSITKQFTASAILKLQEQGKLKVQDKLSKYFPDFPRGDEVTLHHLLTHTSCIRSYTDKPGFLDKVGSPVEPED